MDTDAATIAVGTTPRGGKGAVASLGGRSRVCVDFSQPSPSSTSAIVAVVDKQAIVVAVSVIDIDRR